MPRDPSPLRSPAPAARKGEAGHLPQGAKSGRRRLHPRRAERRPGSPLAPHPGHVHSTQPAMVPPTPALGPNHTPCSPAHRAPDPPTHKPASMCSPAPPTRPRLPGPAPSARPRPRPARQAPPSPAPPLPSPTAAGRRPGSAAPRTDPPPSAACSRRAEAAPACSARRVSAGVAARSSSSLGCSLPAANWPGGRWLGCPGPGDLLARR